MSQTFEPFKNATAGIQSVVISFAAIATGVWAVYEFNVARADRQATLEESAMRDAIASTEAASLRIPVLRLDLSTEVLPTPEDNAVRHVHVEVRVENVGQRETVLDFYNDTSRSRPPTPLAFGRLERGLLTAGHTDWRVVTIDRYVLSSVPDSTSHYTYTAYTALRPGASETFRFMAVVEEPGVYLAHFSVRALDGAFDNMAGRMLTLPSDSTMTTAAEFNARSFVLVDAW